ncbi:hypothetical protein ACFL3C_05335 [Patescibacteria group bacterium]
MAAQRNRKLRDNLQPEDVHTLAEYAEYCYESNSAEAQRIQNDADKQDLLASSDSYRQLAEEMRDAIDRGTQFKSRGDLENHFNARRVDFDKDPIRTSLINSARRYFNEALNVASKVSFDVVRGNHDFQTWRQSKLDSHGNFISALSPSVPFGADPATIPTYVELRQMQRDLYDREQNVVAAEQDAAQKVLDAEQATVDAKQLTQEAEQKDQEAEQKKQEVEAKEQDLVAREAQLAAGLQQLAQRDQAQNQREDALNQQEAGFAQRGSDLNQRETDASQLEAGLNQREQNIGQQEADLNQREQDIGDKEQVLITKGDEALAKERALAAKEQEVAAREQKARQTMDELVNDRKELGEKEAQLAQRASELDAKSEALRVEAGRLAAEDQRLQDLDAELTRREAAIAGEGGETPTPVPTPEPDADLAKLREELQRKERELSALQVQLDGKGAELDARESTVQEMERLLEDKKTMLAEQSARLDARSAELDRREREIAGKGGGTPTPVPTPEPEHGPDTGGGAPEPDPLLPPHPKPPVPKPKPRPEPEPEPEPEHGPDTGGGAPEPDPILPPHPKPPAPKPKPGVATPAPEPKPAPEPEGGEAPEPAPKPAGPTLKPGVAKPSGGTEPEPGAATPTPAPKPSAGIKGTGPAEAAPETTTGLDLGPHIELVEGVIKVPVDNYFESNKRPENKDKIFDFMDKYRTEFPKSLREKLGEFAREKSEGLSSAEISAQVKAIILEEMKQRINDELSSTEEFQPSERNDFADKVDGVLKVLGVRIKGSDEIKEYLKADYVKMWSEFSRTIKEKDYKAEELQRFLSDWGSDKQPGRFVRAITADLERVGAKLDESELGQLQKEYNALKGDFAFCKSCIEYTGKDWFGRTKEDCIRIWGLNEDAWDGIGSELPEELEEESGDDGGDTGGGAPAPAPTGGAKPTPPPAATGPIQPTPPPVSPQPAPAPEPEPKPAPGPTVTDIEGEEPTPPPEVDVKGATTAVAPETTTDKTPLREIMDAAGETEPPKTPNQVLKEILDKIPATWPELRKKINEIEIRKGESLADLEKKVTELISQSITIYWMENWNGRYLKGETIPNDERERIVRNIKGTLKIIGFPAEMVPNFSRENEREFLRPVLLEPIKERWILFKDWIENPDPAEVRLTKFDSNLRNYVGNDLEELNAKYEDIEVTDDEIAALKAQHEALLDDRDFSKKCIETPRNSGRDWNYRTMESCINLWGITQADWEAGRLYPEEEPVDDGIDTGGGTPEPEPAPTPQPAPAPAPKPEPAPAPQPQPEPEPAPAPEPQPEPAPAPQPSPVPPAGEVQPTPQPPVGPTIIGTPPPIGGQPIPPAAPIPAPAPTPEPEPAPTPPPAAEVAGEGPSPAPKAQIVDGAEEEPPTQPEQPEEEPGLGPKAPPASPLKPGGGKAPEPEGKTAGKPADVEPESDVRGQGPEGLGEMKRDAEVSEEREAVKVLIATLKGLKANQLREAGKLLKGEKKGLRDIDRLETIATLVKIFDSIKGFSKQDQSEFEEYLDQQAIDLPENLETVEAEAKALYGKSIPAVNDAIGKYLEAIKAIRREGLKKEAATADLDEDFTAAPEGSPEAEFKRAGTTDVAGVLREYDVLEATQELEAAMKTIEPFVLKRIGSLLEKGQTHEHAFQLKHLLSSLIKSLNKLYELDREKWSEELLSDIDTRLAGIWANDANETKFLEDLEILKGVDKTSSTALLALFKLIKALEAKGKAPGSKKKAETPEVEPSFEEKLGGLDFKRIQAARDAISKSDPDNES